MRNLNRLLLILAAALAASLARAAYEDVGVGARVSGLGGAYTAVADDVYSVYYNPAGLGTLDRPELATSYSKLLTGLSDSSNLQNSFLAYARPIKDGRQGTYGLAWNYFSLDSLYREMTFFGSYGRPLFEKSLPNTLYGGVSLKMMRRSLGSVSQADAPIGDTGQVQIGAHDPVLQNRSKMNLDADLGFLYRPRPRWTLGLMIQHLMEPNIAFSDGDTDKLGRNIKLGGSYKTPFSTLTGDLDFMKAPSGSTDRIIVVGAEKWLPTLIHGTFGLRGSLGFGSRDYRQLTVGLSYKIYRMQFDYGFALPLGGITGTMGTHRLGITFRFGRPRQPQALYAESILENMRDLARVNTPDFQYQMADLAQHRREALEEFLRHARVETAEGRFASALHDMDEAVALKPGDELLEGSQKRMKTAAGFFPVVEGFRVDPSSAAVYDGILEYLAGKDWEAGSKISYALSLDPKNETLRGLLQAIEPAAAAAAPAAGPKPLPVPAAGAAPAEKGVGGDMALMEVALREKEYDKVLALAAQVVRKDPANSLAYMRMGTAYYNLKRYPEALQVLESAQRLETDPEFKKQLKQYMAAIAELNAAMEAAKAASQAKPAAPARPARPFMSPQEIERTYEAGVDLYAQRKFAEAAAAFKKILDADPNNISARRALDRVEAEMHQGEPKP